MMTAKGSVDNKAEGLDAGCDDYIAKPCIPNVMAKKIESWLQIQESRRLNSGSEHSDPSIDC